MPKEKKPTDAELRIKNKQKNLLLKLKQAKINKDKTAMTSIEEKIKLEKKKRKEQLENFQRLKKKKPKKLENLYKKS